MLAFAIHLTIAIIFNFPQKIEQENNEDFKQIEVFKLVDVQEYKQGIGGIVYLELFIDSKGIIKNIKVLKDPGYGFAKAAIDALFGITCIPAKANENPVPVRFRYPVKFTIK